VSGPCCSEKSRLRVEVNSSGKGSQCTVGRAKCSCRANRLLSKFVSSSWRKVPALASCIVRFTSVVLSGNQSLVLSLRFALPDLARYDGGYEMLAAKTSCGLGLDWHFP